MDAIKPKITSAIRVADCLATASPRKIVYHFNGKLFAAFAKYRNSILVY